MSAELDKKDTHEIVLTGKHIPNREDIEKPLKNNYTLLKLAGAYDKSLHASEKIYVSYRGKGKNLHVYKGDTRSLRKKVGCLPFESVKIGMHACIDNDIYTDVYLEQISKLYPLDEVLDSRKTGISNGEWNDLNHFTMGSPLGNSEGEQILNSILYVSANTDKWQPKIIDVDKLTDTKIETANEYITNVGEISSYYGRFVGPGCMFNMMDKGTIFALSVAKRGGFVELTTFDNKVVVLPTPKFIEYCISQNK